jgi:hypothetical protein
MRFRTHRIPHTAVLVVIIEDSDGDRLAEVPITIKTGRRKINATSDEEGEATFEALAPGNYEVFVGTGDDTLRAERDLELSNDEEMEVLYVHRDANQSVAGRVTDSLGNPLTQVPLAVALLRRTADETFLLGAFAQRRLLTRELGEFEFVGLPEGNYEIILDASREFAAKRLNVMAPADGIEIVLYQARAVTIQGRVLDPDRQVINDAWVTVSGRVW